MTLFDAGPAEVTPADPAPLSYGQRLTIRRRADLAAGRHPVTGLPLLSPDWGYQCGTCAHLIRRRYSRTYVKCALRETGAEATDVRLHWPACTRYRIDPNR